MLEENWRSLLEQIAWSLDTIAEQITRSVDHQIKSSEESDARMEPMLGFMGPMLKKIRDEIGITADAEAEAREKEEVDRELEVVRRLVEEESGESTDRDLATD